ncbi:MAG TPA: hypothetical protein VIO14_00920 [Dehalococcoidia bacterium]
MPPCPGSGRPPPCGGSWARRGWPLLLLPGVLAVVGRGVVAREERYLECRFGEAYRRHRRRVPHRL